MRMGSYEVDAPELLALGDCDDGLCGIDRVRELAKQSMEGGMGAFEQVTYRSHGLDLLEAIE